MALFQSFDIAASGMTAQRFRMDTIAENIANINTTHTEDGSGPYRRKIVTFEERQLTPSFADTLENYRNAYKGNGVRVSKVSEDTESDFIMSYDPSNPDADENGYVSYPNVNTVTEMTNLIDATRSYQANVTAFNSLKAMAQQGITIGNS
ncbi:flagellar basal-body rod protein FlgC [Lachnospiraceae bacterium C10]|jgi:flagellar basal-body rod protein FlgC|nr:flagellar basal body rod protein FlgC [Lachnospiraceae bacterium]SCW28544.1 flagellar basal-body rod protein FlgC [Lachnospiraceae bacterium C10]SDW00424.1 flagellar basal-body rod protein FlgC [Lachnospiraceae bacterium KHCPX20]